MVYWKLLASEAVIFLTIESYGIRVKASKIFSLNNQNMCRLDIKIVKIENHAGIMVCWKLLASEAVNFLTIKFKWHPCKSRH